MEEWKIRMYEAIAEYLRKYCEADVAKVTSFEDVIDSPGWGSCSSCSYETIECEIYYLDSKGTSRHHTLTKSFADLISEL